MNKNQIKGRGDEVTGKGKEAVGRLIGDKSLETKGRIQKIGGRAETGYGDFRRNMQKSNRKG